MTDLAASLALKQRLPRTWAAFFGRHGNFTPVQIAAIPAVLDGRNVVICAATAGGKTEAAVAPLIERHFPVGGVPASGPRLLYFTPTRALANDLWARLAYPLQSLDVSVGIKTHDVSTFRADRPPHVLIATPESTDSLLTGHARLLANLQTIVIDEVHLFAGTPRSDQLRVILNRIRRIRDYACEQGDTADRSLQYVALSATVVDPAAVAAHYFDHGEVIQIPGRRAWETEWVALSTESGDELIAYLETFRTKGWRKALVFCNSRGEVEAYAAAVRNRSPFGHAVYVHYSNIDAARRREIELEFAQAGAAICFATNTLELGIDIGNVDVVVLVGPPGSPESFTQRVGRGNRRSLLTSVACCYRTRLERLLFEALALPPETPVTGRPMAFRPSVAIQQIFSLIKQSPVAAVRLAELSRLFEGMVSPVDLQAIVGQLQKLRYLKPGRPGEWRPGERLNDLYDEQTRAQCSRSIYSNVQSGQVHLIDIRDQHTGRVIATADAQLLDRPVLTVEGRAINVEWWDGEVLWVSSYQGRDAAQQLIYRSTRQLLSYDVARRLPTRLGLSPGTAPFVEAPDGWYWFHWLGDLYGRAALDLLRYHVPAQETAQIGLCLRLPDEPRAAPAWSEDQVIRYLEDNYRKIEPLLELGPFHNLLPAYLRRRTVVEQFGVAAFLEACTGLRPFSGAGTLASCLLDLIHED